jgi:hypothetical protein
MHKLAAHLLENDGHLYMLSNTMEYPHVVGGSLAYYDAFA